jgi:hypothetical protein
LAGAKRNLHKFKDDLERADATKGNTSFAKVVDDYAEMFSREAERKRDGVESWFGIDSLRFPCYLPFKSQCTDAC